MKSVQFNKSNQTGQREKPYLQDSTLNSAVLRSLGWNKLTQGLDWKCKSKWQTWPSHKSACNLRLSVTFQDIRGLQCQRSTLMPVNDRIQWFFYTIHSTRIDIQIRSNKNLGLIANLTIGLVRFWINPDQVKKNETKRFWGKQQFSLEL